MLCPKTPLLRRQKNIGSLERDFRALQFETIMGDARTSFHVRQLRHDHFPFFWHYHPELEIDLILKGQGLRFIGDSVANFEEGDLCLVGSNLPHTWHSRPRKSRRARSIYVQFMADCLGPNFFSLPEMRNIARLFRRADRGLRFTGAARDEAARRLVALTQRGRPGWRRLADFLALLGTLAECDSAAELTTATTRAVREPQGDRRLRQVLDFMNAAPHTIPSQQRVAREARLSPAAFSRFFRRGIGKTYVRYRNELRIGRACRLLIDTDLSVTQVSLEAGFNNLSNFNAQFLELKGVTPRAYRHSSAEE